MTGRTHPDSGRATGGIVQTLQDRIADLKAQLASANYTAADMATASAQGFRDGVASLSANAGERVYAFRRNGMDDFCTCDEERYEELSNKPHLFETRIFYTAPQPSPTAQAAESVGRDAERYRWLAGHCRSTSEHWGGRWSIVVEGPAPKSHDSEDDFDDAIDAAMAANGGNK